MFHQRLWLLIGLLLFACAANVRAGGFAQLDMGATRAAMQTVVAGIDDATAIYHNPACLIGQHGTRFYLAATSFFLNGRFKIRDYAGNESNWIKPDRYFGFSPFIGLTSDLNSDNWAAGAALYFPNAYGADMPENSPTRYALTDGLFITAYFTPTLSYRLTPKLSVGLGVSYVYVDLSGTRRLHGDVLLGDILLSEYPDAEEDWELELTGREHSYNWDVGLLWKPIPRLRLGLTYSAERELSLSGEANITDVNPDVNPDSDLIQILVALIGKNSVDVEVNMLIPRNLRLGVQYDASDKWTLGFDVVWWDYSRYEEQRITTDPVIPMFDLTTEKNYSDSYQIDLGARYRISANTNVLAGLMYDWSPIPDESYSLESPTSDIFCYSLGVSRNLGDSLEATVAWSHNFYKDKRIDEVNYKPNIRPIGEAQMYEVAIDLAYHF